MVNGVDGVVSWDGTTFVAETVTAPAGETWIIPAKFDKVLSHMNRLWFADSQNLAVYYLPVQTKSRGPVRGAAQRDLQARRHHPGHLHMVD